MQTPETLKENNDSLYEWLNLPAENFKFWSNLPDWDPENAEKSAAEKSEFIQKFIENSLVDKDTKEVLKGILEWSADDEETINKIYEKIKNFPKEKRKDLNEVNKLTQGVLEESLEYAISEPEKLYKLIENLHLPMNKKDILRSLILSNTLPLLGIPMPVDPMAVNALYNSKVLSDAIKNKMESDTKFAKNTAKEITKTLFKTVFGIEL